MTMATEKETTTTATQANIPARDLAAAICARPWMVELSRNSRKAVLTILSDDTLTVFTDMACKAVLMEMVGIGQDHYKKC